jgi:D-alanyl-lipoteichoic acid acyltransferase DltB (MBOAT superfamily)
MLFNSPEFAIFFPIVTLLYFLTPHRLRWLTLLAASCVFYAAFIPKYILILFGMILVDYTAARLIERSSGTARRAMLAVSLSVDIGVLATFKYYNFFAAEIAAAGARMGLTWSLPLLRMALPLGLSFHTFQAMAYTIEVYRGRWRAERHLGIYALYVMFYPQLVAGPIERPERLLPQFRVRHAFDPQRAAMGLKLMAWGLFKKVVIADRLAQTVNVAYTRPRVVGGPAMMVATFFFAWQIYCDFSGYSDIAIGAAEVMGFTLTPNFRRPYLARSTREFWTRWHISLSTWFRDFVYIPLGGNRAGRRRWVLALTITFLLSGLWHGANWTFVIWGAMNGLFLLVGALTMNARLAWHRALGLDRWPRVDAFLQRTITFVLIAVSWIFFRSDTVGDASYILRHLFSASGLALSELGVTAGQFALSWAAIFALAAIETLEPSGDPRAWLAGRPAWARWACYYAIILLTMSVGVFNRSRFIYFQF